MNHKIIRAELLTKNRSLKCQTHTSYPSKALGTTRMVAIVIVIIVLAGAAGVILVASHSSPNTSATSTFATSTSATSTSATSTSATSTSATSTLLTCTVIPAISYMYCGSPLRISADGEPGASPTGGGIPGDGSWNFTVSISSNSVTRGQTILLVANLTNIGPNTTIKEFVKPYINPGIYATNGTEVWAWNPPHSTSLNITIASGETISQDVNIPTSQLLVGQSYLIKVAPLSIQFPTPNNLTFTFQFSVR